MKLTSRKRQGMVPDFLLGKADGAKAQPRVGKVVPARIDEMISLIIRTSNLQYMLNKPNAA